MRTKVTPPLTNTPGNEQYSYPLLYFGFKT
jgi:hypothetical protein